MTIQKKINWLATWTLLKSLRHALSNRTQDGKNNAALLLPQINTARIYNRVDFIADFCKNKNVLHVGCTDHPYTIKKLKNNSLLHLQLKKITAKTIGVDNSKSAIEAYLDFTGNNDVYYCDIMQCYPAEIFASEFDVVLFGEVLEHLINPSKALEVLYDHFNHGTSVLVSVPNYTSLNAIAASLNKTESIHPDHYWYFSPYTLCKLFDNKRFELQQLHFGMYYQKNKKINRVMKEFSFNGDCIIAVFSIKK